MGYVSLGKQIVCQQLPPKKKSHTTHDGSQAMNFSRPKKSPQDFRWDPQIPSLQARQLLVCKALSHPFEDSQTSCAVSSLEGQGALFVEFWDYSLPWLHQPRGFRAKKALIRTWAEQMSKTKIPRPNTSVQARSLTSVGGLWMHFAQTFEESKVDSSWNCCYCTFCGWESFKPIKFMNAYEHIRDMQRSILPFQSFPAKFST